MSDPAGSSLPSELWLQIFADDVFEKNDHRDISLTCRQFRPLAQPFLLRALTLQQVFQHWISDLDGRPRDFEDRLQRFQFYASDAIAPALQNLSVLLPYDHISRPGFKELRGPVLEALFRALPHFVNLHTIDFVSVALTAHHLEVISGLRSVRRARFHECAILAEAQAVPRLLVKHLEITTSGRTPDQAALWAATLDPESLQSLLISPSPTFLSLTSTPHFPRLRALSIDITHDEEHGLSTLESEDFRAFLLRSCSAVEQVEVYSDTPVISPVVLRGALPLLREYCGPYEVESLFTESRSVRHLTLRGTCWPSLPPRQIVEIWEGSSALPDLVSLDAQTGNLKGLSPFELPLLLLHVQSRCNRLRALTVCYDYCIDTIDGNSALVVDEIRKFVAFESWPRLLEYLHIEIEIRLRVERNLNRQEEDDAIKEMMDRYISAMARFCPALRYVAVVLRIDGETFTWRYDPVANRAVRRAYPIEDWRADNP